MGVAKTMRDRLSMMVAWIGVLTMASAWVQAQPEKEKTAELPEEVVKRFEELGGQYGHFEINSHGEFAFKPGTSQKPRFPLPWELRGLAFALERLELREQDREKRQISVRLPGF